MITLSLWWESFTWKDSACIETGPVSLHQSPSSWCVPFTECIYVCYDNSYWQLSAEGLACHLGYTYITALTPCALVLHVSQFLSVLINSLKISFRNIFTYFIVDVWWDTRWCKLGHIIKCTMIWTSQSWYVPAHNELNICQCHLVISCGMYNFHCGFIALS